MLAAWHGWLRGADSNGRTACRRVSQLLVAGSCTLREFTLCYAPTGSSYKRFADSSFAGLAGGVGQCTCAPAGGGWPQAKTSGRMPEFRAVMVNQYRWHGSHCWRVVTVSSGIWRPSLCRQRLPAPMSNGCRLRWPTPRRCLRILRWCAGVRRGCCRALPGQRACGAGGVPLARRSPVGEDTWDLSASRSDGGDPLRPASPRLRSPLGRRAPGGWPGGLSGQVRRV